MLTKLTDAVQPIIHIPITRIGNIGHNAICFFGQEHSLAIKLENNKQTHFSSKSTLQFCTKLQHVLRLSVQA